VGTWTYWAPEQVDEKRAYDQQVDMWSLGVLLYIMLSGRHPFERAHAQHGDQARSGRQEQMLQDILHANYAFDPAQWTGASRAGDRGRSARLIASRVRLMSADCILIATDERSSRAGDRRG
jgi:serine/threonine protein kinase